MRVLRAWWGSTHPGPTVVVTALALALGVSIGLEPWRLALLTSAVFCGQLSVGLSNDVLDAPRDRAVGRADKPIARGELSVGAAGASALILLAVALGLSAPLGWRMLAAHAVFLGASWAYNAGLKATAASIAPFLVGFGIFPSLATLTSIPPVFAPAWAWVAGAALGAAVHLTNVLPDLDDDARTGVRGLPHRLGARLSAVLAGLSVIAGAVAVLFGAAGGQLGDVGAVSWAFFLAVVLVAAITGVRAAVRAPSRAVFRLVMLAGLLLAAQLVVAGPALLA